MLSVKRRIQHHMLHAILRTYRLEYIEDRLSRSSLAAFTELSTMSDIPATFKWIISDSNKKMFLLLHVRNILTNCILFPSDESIPIRVGKAS